MLTPSERRGALIVIALLAIGTCWDWWRAVHPVRRELGFVDPPGASSAGLGAQAMPDTAPAVRAPAAASGLGAAGSNPATGVARARRGKPLPARPIDLNRAGVEEFHALPGIGPVLARRIVEYRRAHGRFTSVEELRVVRGIGPHLFERIRPFVRV